MNIIETNTHTTITKVSAPEGTRGKDTAGTKNESDKLSEAKEVIAQEEAQAAPKAKTEEMISFRIQGSEENVNTAHQYLQQIIGGEFIRNVLAKIQGQPLPLSRREDSDKHRDRDRSKRFSDVVKDIHGDREKQRDVRPESSREKEREKKSRAVSSGPPATEDKTSEREKEKEGSWRRESKLSDKQPEKPASAASSSGDRSKRRGGKSSSSSSSAPASKSSLSPEKESKKPESKEDSTTKKAAKFVKRVT